MIGVDLVFLFLAGVAFLGFVLQALFEKLRIVFLLPLLLIGVLVGPVLNIVSTGTGSVISVLTPYITALTVAIVLFDAGININVRKLSKVIKKASYFTFVGGVATGVVVAALAANLLNWTAAEALIFGFAVAGTTVVGIPVIVKLLAVPDELRVALTYESIVSDTYQLIVPSLILLLLSSGNVTVLSGAATILAYVIGALIVGSVTALFWLYVMHRFSAQSKDYGWLLTITMIVATYGFAEWLGASGLLTVFVFGILFAAIGTYKDTDDKSLANAIVDRYFYVGAAVGRIKDYQREIAFFASTFFFVYLGLLFELYSVTLVALVGALLVCAVIGLLRFLLVPHMLNDFMSSDKESFRKEHLLSSVNMGRGLSPAIVATLPLAYGIAIPNLINMVFLVILFSNMIATAGIFVLEKPAQGRGPKQKAEDTTPRAQLL